MKKKKYTHYWVDAEKKEVHLVEFPGLKHVIDYEAVYDLSRRINVLEILIDSCLSSLFQCANSITSKQSFYKLRKIKEDYIEDIEKLNLTLDVSRALKNHNELLENMRLALDEWKMYLECSNREDLYTILKTEPKNFEAKELHRCIEFFKKQRKIYAKL